MARSSKRFATWFYREIPVVIPYRSSLRLSPMKLHPPWVQQMSLPARRPCGALFLDVFGWLIQRRWTWLWLKLWRPKKDMFLYLYVYNYVYIYIYWVYHGFAHWNNSFGASGSNKLLTKEATDLVNCSIKPSKFWANNFEEPLDGFTMFYPQMNTHDGWNGRLQVQTHVCTVQKCSELYCKCQNWSTK